MEQGVYYVFGYAKNVGLIDGGLTVQCKCNEISNCDFDLNMIGNGLGSLARAQTINSDIDRILAIIADMTEHGIYAKNSSMLSSAVRILASKPGNFISYTQANFRIEREKVSSMKSSFLSEDYAYHESLNRQTVL